MQAKRNKFGLKIAIALIAGILTILIYSVFRDIVSEVINYYIFIYKLLPLNGTAFLIPELITDYLIPIFIWAALTYSGYLINKSDKSLKEQIFYPQLPFVIVMIALAVASAIKAGVIGYYWPFPWYESFLITIISLYSLYMVFAVSCLTLKKYINF